MYLTTGSYRELYLCLKDKMLIDKFNEYQPYFNTLYNMIAIFNLFSNVYNTEQSCRYMEKVIRFVTRYKIDDNIIDENLINFVKDTGRANTDIFFFMIYSFVKPEEMVKISYKEYFTSFYILLISNFNHWDRLRNDKNIFNWINNIKIDKLKNIILYLLNSNVEKLDDVMEAKMNYSMLAIISCDIYLYDKDYKNIDKYLSDFNYYNDKLKLNSFFNGDYNNYFDFMNGEFNKYLFDNIDSFINDDYNKKAIIR